METPISQRSEQQKLKRSILFPLFFVSVLWFVWIVQVAFNANLSDTFGLFPRTFKGLIGIFTFPLLHANLGHLFSNSLPLLILGAIIFYFYRSIVFEIFSWIYVLTGAWLWLAGRSDTCHIGASGLVYGFATFLFFSGIFRWDKRLLVLSLLTCFLYGSLVWGVLPIDPSISWEGHLLGSFSGVFIAFFYRKEGPKRQEIVWVEEEVLEDENENALPASGNAETVNATCTAEQQMDVDCKFGLTCPSQ